MERIVQDHLQILPAIATTNEEKKRFHQFFQHLLFVLCQYSTWPNLSWPRNTSLVSQHDSVLIESYDSLEKSKVFDSNGTGNKAISPSVIKGAGEGLFISCATDNKNKDPKTPQQTQSHTLRVHLEAQRWPLQRFDFLHSDCRGGILCTLQNTEGGWQWWCQFQYVSKISN